MNVLVTGGAGYMGAMLVPQLLDAGYKVKVIDNLMHGDGRALLGFWAHPSFEFLCGDICDIENLSGLLDGVEAVVHLAAIVGDPACAKSPDLAQAVNLEASLKLFQMSQQAHVQRFIFASTCSNYGRMSDPSQKVDERGELSPLSLYAETKVAVEKAILDAPADNFCATVLRFSTLYGVAPRMRFDLTVNEFTMEALVKKHLSVYGQQFWRPYVHVRDAGRAILKVLQTDPSIVSSEVFNVGANHQNFQKGQIVELISNVVSDLQVDYVHKDEDPRDYRVDFDKIKDVLNFQISRTVEDGILEMKQLIESGGISDFDDAFFRN